MLKARIISELHNEEDVIRIESLEGEAKVSSLEVAGELEVSENGSLGEWLTARISGMIAEHKPYVDNLGISAVDSNNIVGFTVPLEYRNLAGYFILKVSPPTSLGAGDYCEIIIPHLLSEEYVSAVGVIWDAEDSKAVVPIRLNLLFLSSTGTIEIQSGDSSHVLKEGTLCSLAFMPVNYNSGG